MRELADIGYRDRDKPVQPPRELPGGIDRDAAAAEVLSRLRAGRSAWNAADVRGEVERLLARRDTGGDWNRYAAELARAGDHQP